MPIARLAIRGLLLWLVPVTFAGVQVGFDESADFSSYRTYMWRDVTPAARPEIQEMIVEAIESRLAAAGLRSIGSGRPDLYVTSTAFAESGSSQYGSFHQTVNGKLSLIRSEIRDFKIGTLLVEIRDASDDRLIWQAAATESVTNVDTPGKAAKKIDKITGKMFRKFPPGARN